MLEEYRGTDTTILAVPSGGVPVGVAIAEELNLPLEAAVVSKITLPWNTEAGCGAVAFDGTVRINEDLLPHLRLSEQQIAEGVEKTRQKVQRRIRKFLGERTFPDLSRKAVILVDDGLASGFTLLVAVEAVHRLGSREIIIAVPTGSADRLLKVAREVDALYCANIREGWGFAVAKAYRRWVDLEEEEAVRLFKDYQARFQKTPIPPATH
jgi:predicted phosphoribosyltransferase